jgi:hypothetical protein
MTRLCIASLILGALAAAYPERLRVGTERLLRSFPSVQRRCVRFIDRLLLDLEGRYPLLAR